jgi:hypothetical protein
MGTYKGPSPTDGRNTAVGRRSGVVLNLAIFRAGHERCYSVRNVLCPMGYKRRIISSAMHIRSVTMHSTAVYWQAQNT